MTDTQKEQIANEQQTKKRVPFLLYFQGSITPRRVIPRFLIGNIANPSSRRNNRLNFEAVEVPDFKDYFVSFENVVGKYQDLIIRKIGDSGKGVLRQIVKDLETLDSIRCFFAILFLARDEKVTLEQKDDDILVTLITDIPKKSEGNGKNRKSG